MFTLFKDYTYNIIGLGYFLYFEHCICSNNIVICLRCFSVLTVYWLPAKHCVLHQGYSRLSEIITDLLSCMIIYALFHFMIWNPEEDGMDNIVDISFLSAPFRVICLFLWWIAPHVYSFFPPASEVVGIKLVLPGCDFMMSHNVMARCHLASLGKSNDMESTMWEVALRHFYWFAFHLPPGSRMQ